MESDLERGSVSQPSLPETHPAASLAEAQAAFRRAHPRYDDTTVLDELRRTDFTRLDTGGHVYLDYTGAGLYADWQLSEHLELLRTNVFGNPHSVNPTSSAMTALVERAREAVLRFFSASSDEYVAIFTPNATGALRLVGEAYPFHPGDRFLLTFDNHNSVNGIREFARARGAETTYVPSEASDLRVDEQLLPRYLTEVGGEHHNLFAYPAQSNFSGVQHPLEWIEQAHAHGWDVLLDAAAYVPTNGLDLSRWHPDFVALSFYKMFGSPSSHGPGSPAARSSPPSSSASGTSPLPAPPTLRTAPSTFSTCPPSRSACICSARSGSRRSTRASRCSPYRYSTRLDRSGTRTGLRPPRSTAPATSTDAARRSPSTSSTPTDGSSTSATSIALRESTTSRSEPAASATPAPVRSPSRSRAKRSSAASSARQ